MDVDVEPLESQAYRRSKEAAQLQASLQPIVPSTETSPPSIIDHNQGSVPIKRRRSNRGSNLPSQSPTVKRTVSSRRSSAGGENMDFTSGYQMGGSSKSGSPSRRSEPTDGGGIAVKYTPVTGRVSKAKKGVPVHTCEACRPVKVSLLYLYDTQGLLTTANLGSDFHASRTSEVCVTYLRTHHRAVTNWKC